jgi:tetratricopeptide (TPR) repeat protein
MLRLFVLTVCLSAACLRGQSSSAQLARAERLAAQGEIPLATQAFESAVQAAARSADPAELVGALDLACAHYQDTGQAQQAEPCLRRLLSLAGKLLGPQDLSLNRLVNRLAGAYIELRQHRRAERLPLLPWLARLAAEAPLSTDRIDLLGTLAALALVRGDARLSAAMNLEALGILEKRGETQSASAIISLNNLAIAYREGKRLRESEAAILRALTIGETVGFTDTLPMAYSHANLAYLYQAMRRYPEAERHLRHALAIIELRCGPASPRTVSLLTTYAEVLRKLGRKSEARAAESRARSAGVSAFTGHSVDVADLARGR